MSVVSLDSKGRRIYDSPCPPIALQSNPSIVPFILYNDEPGSFPGVAPQLRMNAKRLATPAFIDGPSGAVQTYADLRRDVERFALGLSSPAAPWSGVDQDTVVAVFSPNHFYYMTVLFGILRAGCAVTTSNPNYNEKDFEYQLEDSGASIVVCGESVVDKALKAMSRVGLPESNLIVLPNDPLRKVPRNGAFTLEEFMGAKAVTVNSLLAVGALQPDSYEDNDSGQIKKLLPPLHFTNEGESKKKIAYIVYSSGTTGRSKGVLLSHYNICNNVLQLDGLDGETDYPDEGRRLMGVLPLYRGFRAVAISQILEGVLLIIAPANPQTSTASSWSPTAPCSAAQPSSSSPPTPSRPFAKQSKSTKSHSSTSFHRNFCNWRSEKRWMGMIWGACRRCCAGRRLSRSRR